MSAISVTAANVIPASNAKIERVTAGAAITAGQLVYLDSTDGNSAKAADADAAASAVVKGIALNGAADGQPLNVQTGGDLNPGGTLAVGEAYFLHTTAGGFGVRSELSSGDYATFIGIATTTSNLSLGIKVATAALAS